MSYEENKLMNLKDGRLLLQTLDERKADVYATTILENRRVITSDDLEQGGVNTSNPGTPTSATNRIRTKGLIPVYNGMTVYIKPGDVTYGIGVSEYNASKQRIWSSSVVQETLITFDADGYTTISFYKEDSTADISVSDYDASVVFGSYEKKLESNIDFISKRDGSVLSLGDNWNYTHNSTNIYKYNNNCFYFTGTTHTGNYRYVLLSASTGTGNSSSTGFSTDKLDIPLVTGHKYKFIIERLSSSSNEDSGSLFKLIYVDNDTVKEHASTTITFSRFANNVSKYETEFVALSNQYGVFVKLVSVAYSGTFRIHFEDITDEKITDDTRAMIATSDTAIAASNHAVGDVFVCGDNLLRATSAIAAGESVTTGTGGNAEVISLASYIAEQIMAIAGLRTDVNALKSNGVDPDAAITKNVYVQNGTGSVSKRVISIDDGVISISASGATTGYRGIWITKAIGGTTSTMSNLVPSLDNLEPISKLSRANTFRREIFNNLSSWSGYPSFSIFYCSVDPETDDVTIVRRDNYLCNESNKSICESISIPEGTTHYAMHFYQSGVEDFNLTIYLKFMRLTAEA